MGDIQALMQDFDLLFSNVFSTEFPNKYRFTTVHDCDVRYPVFDQRFNDNEQQIIIAATGASKEDFEISLKDDILSIKRTNEDYDKTNSKFITEDGKSKENPEFVEYAYAKNNISRKKFDIAFKIPKKWDAENLEVELDKGELIITIPVKEEAKPVVKDFAIK